MQTEDKKEEQQSKAPKHDWGGDGHRKFSVCVRCGCEKFKGVYSVRYTTTDGVTSQVAPPCNTQTKHIKP